MNAMWNWYRGIVPFEQRRPPPVPFLINYPLFDVGQVGLFANEILNLGVATPNRDILERFCHLFQMTNKKLLNSRRTLAACAPNQVEIYKNEMSKALAKYLTEVYQSNVYADDIFLTCDIGHGWQIILSSLLDKDGYVYVDGLTHIVALDNVRRLRNFNVISVIMNNNGTDLEQFEKLLQAKQFVPQPNKYWAIYYTSTVYQNPSGIVHQPEVCSILIDLARKYNLLIVSEDVHHLLHYGDNAPPKRLFAYDRRQDANYKGNVISNSSFVRMLGPGLRLGWMELPPHLKTILNESNVYINNGCLNQTMAILTDLLKTNMAQPALRDIWSIYRDRMSAVCEIFERNIPGNCEFIRPNGGQFIWISLPKTENAKQFLQACLNQERIYFYIGKKFATAAGIADNCFRLSIAFHDEQTLRDVCFRICSAMQRFLNRQQ